MSAAALLESYFNTDLDPADLPPYFTIGAREPGRWIGALDSSDQSVLALDGVTGVAACRSGLNLVGADQEVERRSLGEILYVGCNPMGPAAQLLRAKLALEQSLRLNTGRRPVYHSLRTRPPMLPPRTVAAGVRVAEDYRLSRTFANSVYALSGMLFLADGRLNAQNFPGAPAVDALGRLMRARGVRHVGLAKDGLLVSVVRREARTIRRRVGLRPFAFPVLKRHLIAAYRGSGQSTEAPKTLRHGSSTMALGGVGAVRLALSISDDNLYIVEFNLYDCEAFAGLVRTGERLESYLCRRTGVDRAFYSWHLLPFVTGRDVEELIVPALEEIVFHAHTDTELGIYPRALADIHRRVKLRGDDPELEATRRQLIAELARRGIPTETINLTLEGPHKTDPDEFDNQ